MTAALTEAEKEQLKRLLDVVRSTICEMDATAIVAAAPPRAAPSDVTTLLADGRQAHGDLGHPGTKTGGGR